MKLNPSILTRIGATIIVLTILLLAMSMVAKGDTIYTVTMTAPGGG